MPVGGYEEMPIVPLEISVEPLVNFLPAIESYAYVAKQRCKSPPADGLTTDESASIMLHAMSWEPQNKCLYVVLNATLRSKDRDKLKPWFLYLKLFLTALSRLPSTHRIVYRGVKLDLSNQYQKSETIVWWGLSLCTDKIHILQSERFLRETDQDKGLYIIQLQETKPPFPLLQSILELSSNRTSADEHSLPTFHFEKVPLVLLEEAVLPLLSVLPNIQHYVGLVKQRYKTEPADGLTRDESASIMLYTMQWEPEKEYLHTVLNTTLRSRDREKLKPWFSYLKLILTALSRLPPCRTFVYRGVKMDLREQRPVGGTVIWWGFSTCTSFLNVLGNEKYCGRTGTITLFSIECDSGRDISRHFYYESDYEVLLPAARQFKVIASMQNSSDLHLIQLQEIHSPLTLLHPLI